MHVPSGRLFPSLLSSARIFFHLCIHLCLICHFINLHFLFLLSFSRQRKYHFEVILCMFFIIITVFQMTDHFFCLFFPPSRLLPYHCPASYVLLASLPLLLLVKTICSQFELTVIQATVSNYFYLFMLVCINWMYRMFVHWLLHLCISNKRRRRKNKQKWSSWSWDSVKAERPLSRVCRSMGWNSWTDYSYCTQNY